MLDYDGSQSFSRLDPLVMSLLTYQPLTTPSLYRDLNPTGLWIPFDDFEEEVQLYRAELYG